MLRQKISLIVIATVSVVSIGCGDSPSSPEPSLTAASNAGETTGANEPNEPPEQDEPPVSAAIEVPTADASVTDEPVEETAFDRLCKAYTNGDADGWASAEQEILKAGHAATPILVTALNEGAEHERELAASLLAQTGAISPKAKAALRKALTDESTFVRANAVAALCASGDSSPELIEVLEELLGQNDTDSRVMAVVSIGNLGEKAESFVPVITELLKDKDTTLRQAAVSALGQIGSKGQPALEQLESIASEDPDEATRQAAVAAIALIRGEEPKAVDPVGDTGTEVIPASSTREVGK